MISFFKHRIEENFRRTRMPEKCSYFRKPSHLTLKEYFTSNTIPNIARTDGIAIGTVEMLLVQL